MVVLALEANDDCFSESLAKICPGRQDFAKSCEPFVRSFRLSYSRSPYPLEGQGERKKLMQEEQWITELRTEGQQRTHRSHLVFQ